MAPQPSTQQGSSEQGQSASVERSGGGGGVARRDTGGAEVGALQSDRGTTTVADVVVSKVAGIAAREVSGVHALGGGVSRALGGVGQRVGIGDQRSQGVSVEVGSVEAAVDLSMIAEYGESIPRVVQSVRENIVKRIEGLIGLKVTEVNIAVNDLYFPGDDEGDEQQQQPTRVS